MLTQVLAADAHKFSSHVQWSNRVVKYESVTQQWNGVKRSEVGGWVQQGEGKSV